MARQYKVSADVSEQEKIVGGVMTLNQAAWLVLGFLIGGGLFLLFAQFIPPTVALFFAVPIMLGIGLPFAFYKKEGLTLFEYIVLTRKFKKKSKQLIHDAINPQAKMREDQA